MKPALDSTYTTYSSLKTAGLALSIESRLIRHYGELANRLRPFDLGIYQLLEMLVREREQQRAHVKRMAHAMFGTVRLLNPPCKQRLRHPVAGHFFILNWQDAAALIRRAARLEYRTSRFYCRSGASERYAQLRHLYWDLCESDGSRAEVLMEALEGFGREPIPCVVNV